MLNRKFIGLVAVCVLLLAAPLSATIVEYADRVTWELTTPGLSTINFDDGDYDNSDTYQSYNTASGLTINGIQFIGQYSIDTYFLYVVHENISGHDFDSGAILKGPAYQTANAYRYIQVNLPTGITSFGVDLMSVGTNQEGMSILINPGAYSTAITTGIQPGSTFFGVTSDDDITQIQFKLTSGTSDVSLPALDDFSFGAAADLSAVPEPGTYLMVGAGLLLIFRIGRKKHTRN